MIDQGDDQQQTPEEYMKALQASMGKKPPVDGQVQVPPVDDPNHPTASFLQQLIHGTDGKSGFGSGFSRGLDIASAVGTGIGGAAEEAVNTIAQGAAWVDRKTGLGELEQPGYNKAFDTPGGPADLASPFSKPVGALKDFLGGRKSDDPLASFAQQTAQFTTGLAMLPELKGPKVLAALLKGGAVEGTMFDPYKDGLAEFAARAPVQIIKQLGELGSVKGDDGPIVARLKRAASGLISMTAIESAVAVARIGKAALVARSAAATAAEKSAALETINSSSKTLQDAADGTLVPDGAHVIPKANGDGTFSLAQTGKARPVVDEVDAVSPKFSDRAEAETQAASINGSIDQHLNAGKPLAPGVISSVTEAAKDPTTLQAFADDPQLGQSIHDTPEQTAALVKQLSDHIYSVISESRAKDNKVPDALQGSTAADVVASIPAGQEHAVATGLMQDSRINSISTLASKIVLRSQMNKVGDLMDGLTARPHDPAIRGDLRTAVEQAMDLKNTQEEILSEHGRALRNEQARGGDAETPAGKPLTLTTDASAAQRKQLAETGFAGMSSDASPTSVELPASGAGRSGSTVYSIKAAKAAIGDAEFRTQVSEEIAKRGGATSPEVEMAATEQVARRIASNPDGEAAKVASMNARDEVTKPHGTNRDTDAVTATDFSLARAKAKMESLAKSLDGLKSDPEAAKALAEKIRAAADEAREEGITPATARDAAEGAPPKGGNPIEKMSALLDQADALLDTKTATPEPAVQGQEPFATKSPMDNYIASKGRLSDDEIENAARMMKLSGDEGPRNIRAIVEAMHIEKSTGIAARGVSWFVNNLLSSPLTWAKVAASTSTMTMFEPAMRVAAGLMFRDKAMIQQGADILYGNFKYFGENVASARMALNEGRAITNPMPQHIVEGSALEGAQRLPGRVLTGLHEFATVTNYRSYVRSLSLKTGRSLGLNGDALSQYVEKDLTAAFDSKTGIATIPQGVQYAEHTTFTGALGSKTFGGAMQTMTNNSFEAKMVLPFVKIGTNIFRYTAGEMSPVGLAKAATGDLDDENNQVALARGVIGTSMYATAMYAAYGDNLTGAGPGDPLLRAQWLGSHKPYSFRVGDQWIPYSAIEPFSTVFGIAGDLVSTFHEAGDDTKGIEKAGLTLISGISHNLMSKSYFTGLTTFMDAFAKGDAKKLQYYIEATAKGVLPWGSAMSKFNPDDTLRQTRSIVDGYMANIPGLSKTLDPQYSIFGEPQMKAPWSATQDVTHGVEEQLYNIGKGLAPFAPKMQGSQIDLSNRTLYDNGTGVSPYTRVMELLREPGYGRPPMKEAMEALVQSARFKNASGTVTAGDFSNVGGRKFDLASSVKSEYEIRAMGKVMGEYPKLRAALRQEGILQHAALTGGPDAQSQVNSILNKTK